MDEKDKIIADLRKQLAEKDKLISELLLRIAKLEKNSSTSSKPPSSDIVKPPKAPPLPNGQKRKRGGQPKHKRHQRVPFTPQEIDVVIDIKLSEEKKVCSCGGVLEPMDVPPRIFQQVELSEREIQIRQYQMSAWRCPHCHKVHYPPLPPGIKKAGLFGPQLQAVVIYMKGQDSTIPPTNNHAERQIRPVAIERYITHGCGTQTGEHFVERLWTVLATCRQQGRDILHFLKECVTASISGTRYPSLLPNG